MSYPPPSSTLDSLEASHTGTAVLSPALSAFAFPVDTSDSYGLEDYHEEERSPNQVAESEMPRRSNMSHLELEASEGPGMSDSNASSSFNRSQSYSVISQQTERPYSPMTSLDFQPQYHHAPKPRNRHITQSCPTDPVEEPRFSTHSSTTSTQGCSIYLVDIAVLFTSFPPALTSSKTGEKCEMSLRICSRRYEAKTSRAPLARVRTPTTTSQAGDECEMVVGHARWTDGWTVLVNDMENDDIRFDIVASCADSLLEKEAHTLDTAVLHFSHTPNNTNFAQYRVKFAYGYLTAILKICPRKVFLKPIPTTPVQSTSSTLAFSALEKPQSLTSHRARHRPVWCWLFKCIHAT